MYSEGGLGQSHTARLGSPVVGSTVESMISYTYNTLLSQCVHEEHIHILIWAVAQGLDIVNPPRVLWAVDHSAWPPYASLVRVLIGRLSFTPLEFLGKILPHFRTLRSQFGYDFREVWRYVIDNLRVLDLGLMVQV